MGITQEYVDQYLLSIIPPRDPLLMELEQQAAREGFPIIGPVVGKFLQILIQGIRAARILELGCGFGYSAIWQARAVQAFGGVLTTIEFVPALAAQARNNFRRAGLEQTVKLIEGDARSVISSLQQQFDLILLDAEKKHYLTLLESCVTRLRVGGLLVADNALWGGLVASRDQSDETRQIRAYNQRVMTDPRLESVIVPLRDGLAVSLRKQ